MTAMNELSKIETLSLSQLVNLYNLHAEKKVVKFASRKIAMVRVAELLASNKETSTMTRIALDASDAIEVKATRIALDASDVKVVRIALDASDPVEYVFDYAEDHGEDQGEQSLIMVQGPEITDLEHRVLAGVAESDFQDGNDPEDCKLVWSFSVTQFLSNKRSAGGVIASLVKKGLLTHTPKNGDCDECVGFTKLGAMVYRAKVETQPLPTVEKKAKKATRKALDASDPVKAKRVRAEKEAKPAREPSKVEIMFAMILEEGGALRSSLLKVCGWKGCGVALGRACEKQGMELVKVKLATGDWNYSAVAKIEA